MTTPMQTTEKKSQSVFFRTVIGFFVVTFFGTVFAQSDMMQLYLISIVCTLGIGFFFWVSIWWLVGTCVLALWALPSKFRALGPVDGVVTGGHSLNPHQRATVDFISRSRELGWTDAQIGQRLKDQGGWADSQIAEAFDWKRDSEEGKGA